MIGDFRHYGKMASSRNPSIQSEIAVLAVDLDGTFLPLDETDLHRAAMDRLGGHFVGPHRCLVYVTGRHYASVREVMKRHRTPLPHRIICDVGTSIYRPNGSHDYKEAMAYRRHLDELTRALPLVDLKESLQSLHGLREQEPEKQGPHKLSYYTHEEALADRVAAIEAVIADRHAPYSVLGSVDPFNHNGLIDVLPRGVDKAYGLRWLAKSEGFSLDETIFAGDSGNDLAALTAGFRAVLVGNASDAVKTQARQRMEELGCGALLYIAHEDSTRGVLEGCEHFGVRWEYGDSQCLGTLPRR